MKTKTTRPELEQRTAYCRLCSWLDDFDGDEKCSQRARYHASKTGHVVDVYTEKRVAIIPQKPIMTVLEEDDR